MAIRTQFRWTEYFQIDKKFSGMDFYAFRNEDHWEIYTSRTRIREDDYLEGFLEHVFDILHKDFLKWFSYIDETYYSSEEMERDKLANQKQRKEQKQKREKTLIVDMDLSLLDFLEGKITNEKTLNWGVGQIMSKYPKQFNPQVVKKALKQRFLS